MRQAKVAAIVVSHDSGSCLEKCLASLGAQDHGLEQIIVVDSGSSDPSYLSQYEVQYGIQLLLQENIGFSRGNNLGLTKVVPDVDLILFLNPDVFLPVDCVRQALDVLEQSPQADIVSGKLLGYDLEAEKPSGRIDSTGIMRSWYGRWYDRGQGEIDRGQYDVAEEMTALCGALLFCRQASLKTLDAPLFDPDFFLYKEDVELGIRVKDRGWKLLYHPEIVAHHCRGWQG
ncbi:MAG: glycosyltransferase family 2 protein, partial [Thermodesulfobacteriota bacterium]